MFRIALDLENSTFQKLDIISMLFYFYRDRGLTNEIRIKYSLKEFDGTFVFTESPH